MERKGACKQILRHLTIVNVAKCDTCGKVSESDGQNKVHKDEVKKEENNTSYSDGTRSVDVANVTSDSTNDHPSDNSDNTAVNSNECQSNPMSSVESSAEYGVRSVSESDKDNKEGSDVRNKLPKIVPQIDLTATTKQIVEVSQNKLSLESNIGGEKSTIQLQNRKCKFFKVPNIIITCWNGKIMDRYQQWKQEPEMKAEPEPDPDAESHEKVDDVNMDDSSKDHEEVTYVKNGENESPSKMELLEQSIDVPQTATNLLNTLVLNGGDPNQDQEKKTFPIESPTLKNKKTRKVVGYKKVKDKLMELIITYNQPQVYNEDEQDDVQLRAGLLFGTPGNGK